jgi:DNA repair photolyase
MGKQQLNLFESVPNVKVRPQPTGGELLELVKRVHPDFKPVWDGLPADEQLALAAYFLPWKSKKRQLAPTRPRVLDWYCPFAAQSVFPSGHRYCLNVYSGCAHHCEYCYAMSYAPSAAACKRDFRRMLLQDLAELEAFDVPPAPVHLSNSTDPFQPLEEIHGHTRFALERMLEYRHRFTTVTVLTKNPLLAANLGCLKLFQSLSELAENHPRYPVFTASGIPPMQVQVSLAFWRDKARHVYDVAAPSVEDRKQGIRALCDAGIPVVLRIDPLFPRSPLPLGQRKTMADFGLAEAQTLSDLEQLVGFAREVGVRHIVYSPVKIVQPRGRSLSPTMAALRELYRALSAPSRPVWRGGSWRLPNEAAAKHVVGPFLNVCQQAGIAAKFCMQDLTEIP